MVYGNHWGAHIDLAIELHNFAANDESEKTGHIANEVSEASIELESNNIPKIFGIYIPPSVEYIIVVLSVLRCGGDLIIYSGSSFCEDGYHLSDGLHWLVEICGCSTFCFCMEENNKREHNSAVDLVFPCQHEKERLFCYVMHTSGSTGKPKGICGTEQGIQHYQGSRYCY